MLNAEILIQPIEFEYNKKFSAKVNVEYNYYDVIIHTYKVLNEDEIILVTFINPPKNKETYDELKLLVEQEFIKSVNRRSDG